MQRCGLTVHNEDNPVFMRYSFEKWALVRGLAGQRGSFPQNIHCHAQVIRPRCVCVSFPLAGWFMTHRLDVADSRDIVARWCNLAEQRLEYLTELFETGRWRRFHSERAFLENIQEAKTAVETWRSLSTRKASPDNSAVDMSWLGHTQTTLPRAERLGDQPDRIPSPVEIPLQPLEPDRLISAESELVGSDEAPSAPDMDTPALDTAALDTAALDDGREPTLDAIAQRYPLLRNAL